MFVYMYQTVYVYSIANMMETARTVQGLLAPSCIGSCIFQPAYLASGGVEDGGRGRRWPPGYFLIDFKSWGFHGVLLGFDHSDNPLFGPRVIGHALLGWSVPEAGEREREKKKKREKRKVVFESSCIYSPGAR